jgi:hypothetical protein
MTIHALKTVRFRNLEYSSRLCVRYATCSDALTACLRNRKIAGTIPRYPSFAVRQRESRGNQRGPCRTISGPGGRMLSLVQSSPFDRGSGPLAGNGAVLVAPRPARRRTRSDGIPRSVGEIRRKRERRGKVRSLQTVELIGEWIVAHPASGAICGHWPCSILPAAMTAWVRLSTPSFCRIADTCALTVASDTPSS